MLKINVYLIFLLMTWSARKGITGQYGREFFHRFVRSSGDRLRLILKDTPDIGDSIFRLNYYYGPCYFSWYGALIELGVEKSEALQCIWNINEAYVRSFPKPVLHWFAKKMYLGYFRSKAPEAEQSGKAGQLHPFDWRVEYVNIDPHTFGINIYECGMLKLAQRFGYLELFPTVCRMDYLFSHYFGNGFKRTGTLADGNTCCDCVYEVPGACEWAPEKGFDTRK